LEKGALAVSAREEIKSMSRVNEALAVLALGLVISTLASPSVAQRSGIKRSAARAAAIREYSLRAGKYVEHTWGNVEFQTYRACMAQHGQPE
jgi:hypothetical protein